MLNYTYGQNGMSTHPALSRYIHPTSTATLSTWQATGIKAATPAGNLVGQLVFGWLADVLGRKRMCE